MHANFRNGDIIGRVGGDEFLVFLTNITDKRFIEKKAKTIADAFKNTYSGENADYKISGSIGISVYPNDGKTYEELYISADKALYQSKFRGKDCYTFYSSDLADGIVKNLTKVDNEKTLANTYFDISLLPTIFDYLYDSDNSHNSIVTALQLVGQSVNVDRCYIFQTYNDGKTFNSTYEWCDINISSKKENRQNLSTKENEFVWKKLDKDGVVYSDGVKLDQKSPEYVVLAKENIKSILMAQINSKNGKKIIMGLDDCKTNRVWSEKEINSVKYALKMISLFIN